MKSNPIQHVLRLRSLRVRIRIPYHLILIKSLHHFPTANLNLDYKIRAINIGVNILFPILFNPLDLIERFKRLPFFINDCDSLQYLNGLINNKDIAAAVCYEHVGCILSQAPSFFAPLQSSCRFNLLVSFYIESVNYVLFPGEDVDDICFLKQDAALHENTAIEYSRFIDLDQFSLPFSLVIGQYMIEGRAVHAA